MKIGRRTGKWDINSITGLPPPVCCNFAVQNCVKGCMSSFPVFTNIAYSFPKELKCMNKLGFQRA